MLPYNRNSKEEQFQEGFLRELFAEILGYTLNPEPNFNLTTELNKIDEYVPSYDRFKKYFGYMNTGYKGKKYDIVQHKIDYSEQITVDVDYCNKRLIKIKLHYSI